MIRALALFLAVAPRAVAGGEAPMEVLSLVKGACASAASGACPAALKKTLEAADQRAKSAPPEKRAAALEQEMPAINAAAAQVADPALSDALSDFNNTMGRHPEAVDYATRALAADKGDINALVSRSAGNMGMNKLDAAFADADAAVKLAPDDAAALRARALVAYHLGHYVQAEEDARRALALDPNDRAAFYVMQLAAAKVPAVKLDRFQTQLAGDVQREYHGMVQQINQVAERAERPTTMPTAPSVESLLRSASTKIALKDYVGAIADADRALASEGDTAAAYYLRAAANNLLGRYAIAADDATRALVLDPADPRARDTRAWAYNSLGRFRDAIADSTHSLELNPRNAYAYWNLGYAREHMGDLSGMAHALKTAASLSPQFEPAYRDATERHGLDLGGQQPAQPAPSERERARRRSFATVVISSVIGGLLIALGFMHVFGDDAKQAARPAAPTLPDLGAGYTLGKELGVGGMGLVYEAFDRALHRNVAVKVMRPEMLREKGARERFLEEARTVAALHHPAIVDIHAIVEAKAGLCLIFERIEGRTLEDILAGRGKLSLAQARSLLGPVCQGLEFAHRHGVVHRDLKPGNIMVTTAGEVKLMDFGISRHERAPSALTPAQLATARGTPYYMAPEQEYGEVRRESDVFSLGAVLYEMVTGERPFGAPHSIEQKLSRRYKKASEAAPGLPEALDAVIDGALQPDPHERIRTAADFWTQLERVRETQPAAAA